VRVAAPGAVGHEARRILDRVRSLLLAVKERAVHAEHLRRLPEETFEDFQETGLFRCMHLATEAGTRQA
jgi:hypothetical protein